MSPGSGTIGAFSNKLSGQVWVKGRNPSPERTVKRVNLCRTYPERRTTVSALDHGPVLPLFSRHYAIPTSPSFETQNTQPRCGPIPPYSRTLPQALYQTVPHSLLVAVA